MTGSITEEWVAILLMCCDIISCITTLTLVVYIYIVLNPPLMAINFITENILFRLNLKFLVADCSRGQRFFRIQEKKESETVKKCHRMHQKYFKKFENFKQKISII